MEPVLEPGRRLETDLRLIREMHGISVEEIHRTSRIPLDMLQHFEQYGLENHPLFNEVYQRAFIRTYAQAVGVRQDEALSALESQQRGQYRGSLAVTYLGWTPPEPLVPDEPEPEAPEPTPTQSAPKPPPKPVAPPKPAPPPVAEPPLPKPALTPTPQASTVARGTAAPWVIGIVVLLVVGTGIAWYLMTQGAADEPVEEETPVVATPPPPPPAAVTLPDTLRLALVAQNGPIRGSRVRFDREIRRPYWVEMGDSLVFPFADSIVVETTTNAALRLQGRAYPVPPDAELVRITRADVQAFLNSLAN